jgi:hypothetical protein
VVLALGAAEPAQSEELALVFLELELLAIQEYQVFPEFRAFQA